MDNRRHLPPDGGGNPKLSSTAIKSECDTEVRAIRNESGDPGTSTQMFVRKDNLCDVPCKVPRFQYVDFPSLHQCIQQLSVPPLSGWLGSCSMAKAPNHRPTSPREKVPKFKYVDYPSLHHCIQQLSVPPLESWSAGLVRHNAEERHEESGVQKMPSQPGTLRNKQRAKKNETGDQNKDSNRVTACSFPNLDPAKLRNTQTNSVTGKEERPLGGPHQDYTLDRKRLLGRVEKGDVIRLFPATKPQVVSETDCAFVLESGSGSQTETMVVRNYRPSVISMVHTDKQEHWTKADHLEEQWNSPDPVEQVSWNILPESVCPFCQQMFTNLEQFRAHQRSHKDKRPN